MIVDLWLLFFSLLLLWFPRSWLRLGGKGRPSSHSHRGGSPGHDMRGLFGRFNKEVSKPRNWVDFTRAWVAGVAVNHLCFEQKPEDAVTVNILVLQALVFVVAVVIQTVRFGQERITLVAPLFFIVGLSFGFVGWMTALFACVAGLVINRALPGPGVFLFAFAGFEIGFGRMLSLAPAKVVILAGVLALMPILLSAAMGRPLVQLNRPQNQRT